MKINLVKNENKFFEKNLFKSFKKNLNTAKFILGPDVQKLEKNLCLYTGSKNCITTSSGTDALLLSLMVINIKPGDEIITTPFTWISNAEVIRLLGAKIVFADIDKDTFNINPELVNKKITKKTKAIIAVSLFGQCADLFGLKKICKRNKIYLIEDAAQSFGAKINQSFSCNVADISCTSFFPTKILGCLGDGGACFTNNQTIAKKIKMLRNHGKDNKGEFKFIGINGRLDTIQASFLISKLKKLNILIKNRINSAKLYNKNLKPLNKYIETPYINKKFLSVYSQYTIKVNYKRNKLFKYLKSKNIDVKIFYKPIYKNQAYKTINSNFKICEEVSKKVISLPMSSSISKSHQLYIVNCIKKFYE
tara:strand:- start:484 stop:1575 length:1092 start_codon:yes stop_codon:yes gene_type:complete